MAKVKITVQPTEGRRIRVIESAIAPGGAWGSGEVVSENLDPKKGGEYEIDPQNRLIIEEVG